ncbi:MAG TPA: sialidase family protein, partial [Candidatus Limnocylindrales bacterium]
MGGSAVRTVRARSRRRTIAILAGGVILATQTFAFQAGAASIDATYVPQGPRPITGGQVENVTPNNEVAGAVHTIVAHPSDADTLWIGTVNGGIWRTTNATSASPTWTPLTDQQSSLSIGALELDPTVASNTRLLAGFARVSSFGRISGALNGLLLSSNAGTSWTPLGTVDLAGESISGVAPRGNTIVVTSNSNSNAIGGGQGGIFRSTNGGTSFTRLSGNAGIGLGTQTVGIYDLVGDRSNNARLYAGGQQGIFRSDDTGATWTNITNGVALQNAIQAANTNNLELAVHNSGGTNVVYAGVINNGQLGGLFRSTDQGANWTQLDTPVTNEGGTIVGINPRPKPGGQGGVHFSILADATNPNVVYVGGDRQPNNNGFPNAVGANDFSGRLFRCDASLAANAQCTSLTHNGTPNNSAPHADSREMVFDVNGDIVETDDGGVYRQTDPSTTNG